MFKAHLLHKTKTKPRYLQQDQNKRQNPEFLLPFKGLSFLTLKQLLSCYPGSLAFSGCSLTSGSLPFLHVGPVLPSAMWLLWIQGLSNILANLFTRWVRACPFIHLGLYLFQAWVCISFRPGINQVLCQNAQLTPQTSACSGWVHLLTNPFFSPSLNDRPL